MVGETFPAGLIYIELGGRNQRRSSVFGPERGWWKRLFFRWFRTIDAGIKSSCNEPPLHKVTLRQPAFTVKSKFRL